MSHKRLYPLSQLRRAVRACLDCIGMSEPFASGLPRSCLHLLALTSTMLTGCGPILTNICSHTISSRSAFTNNLGMAFVQIPAGDFHMGSIWDETGVPKDERGGPVTISRPFYLATRELTNAQYRQFRPAHDSSTYEREGQRRSLNGDCQPAVVLSWDDAQAFCAWLTRLDSERRAGRCYRLPTEAEWEYAARAGRGWRYPWGNHWPTQPDEANLLEEHTADGHAVAAPVGSYRPNPFGLYDMAGNVWEWCADWYAKLPTKHRTDPTGPGRGLGRVVKGASWDHHSQIKHRCAGRDYLSPQGRWYDVGLRVVCEVGRWGNDE